jgi:hypothetical protein
MVKSSEKIPAALATAPILGRVDAHPEETMGGTCSRPKATIENCVVGGSDHDVNTQSPSTQNVQPLVRTTLRVNTYRKSLRWCPSEVLFGFAGFVGAPTFRITH